MPHDLWTVILAAGAGRRLQEVTGGIPKQFWRADGGPSLLEQTMDRFDPLTPRSRTVVIVNTDHLKHVRATDGAESGPVLVTQPEDRGTAAGVLLALTPVMEHAPESTVIVTPSDHGVLDGAKFRHGVLDAATDARDRIVLFGVEPTRAHTDYGWISLGASSAGGLRPVTSFIEKPAADLAARLFASGAVWNTMVVVARARALWDLYVRRLPDLARVFAGVIERRGKERARFLASAYRTLPARDFSRDLLTGARGLSARVWPAAIGWSDLGTPERLRDWRATVASRARPAASTSAA